MMINKPEASNWTDEQWQAVADEDRPILVAAAAGSGKTAVLVERIVRKVIDPANNVELDQLLVVTFTNAAAAEMKQRIGKAIEKQLIDDPGSIHLRRQLSLLQRASISTLHSFCMNVIRTYYYEIGIDPQFRMLDQTEAQLLEEEAAEELIETAYREDPDFLSLVDYFTGDRTDDQLKELILDLYHFSRAHPDPDSWLDSILEVYESEDQQDFEKMSWVKEAVSFVKEKILNAHGMLETAAEKSRMTEGPAPYLDVLTEDMSKLLSLSAKKSWNELYEEIRQLEFSKLPPISKKKYPDIDPALQKEVQSVRKKVKEELEKTSAAFFPAESDLILDDMQQMAPILKRLVTYVKRFADLFQSIKLERNSLDFSDLEHYCLTLLQDEAQPSSIALQYQQEFQEVLVDEYQDTNFVQESILTMLSGTNHLFMVGDVKQSIYRFRLAEPGLFLEKYHRYQAEQDGTRIDLAKNFRSRREIIYAANYIFSHIMSESFGEMNYDEAASLKQGNEQFPENELMTPEIMIINKQEKENGEAEEELESAQLEARAVAVKIRKIVDERFLIYDKTLGTERPAAYKDIVLLMRSMPWAETMMEEFRAYDIPLYADLSTGYFEAVEIKVMLALLHTVDNPYQDIPLASVLRSPIFSIEEEALSAIRMHAPEEYYYTALQREAESNPDGAGAAALEQLDTWREDVRSMGLSEFIWKVYEESGYLEYIGGLPGGRQRRANLTSLYDRARTYETTSFRGLFRFLRFIERMQERGEDLGKARAIGEQEDVVRLMTVHKSKGLEFPIVFVAGLNKQFNMMDINKAYLKHKNLGFAARYVEPEKRVSYPTLYYHVVRERIRRETLAEEMRVLYVAMTRAEQKLYLTGTVGQAEDAVKGWSSHLPAERVPQAQLISAKNFLDWIMPAVLLTADSSALGQINDAEDFSDAISSDNWKFTILSASSLINTTENAAAHVKEKDTVLQAVKELRPLGEKKEWLDHRFTWEYPYEEAVKTRVKQSVTELKRFEEDPYASPVMQQVSPVFDRPKFVQESAYNPAETGTIMHAVMQHISYYKQTSDEIEKEIQKLVFEEKISQSEAEQINIAWIHAFLNSSAGQKLRDSVRVERELPFTYPVQASKMYPDWSGEEEFLFVQGIIDCIYESADGSLYILDYKTDKTAGRFSSQEDMTAYFKDKYHFQLSLYKQALESAWNRKVHGASLYMFDGNFLIDIE